MAAERDVVALVRRVAVLVQVVAALGAQRGRVRLVVVLVRRVAVRAQTITGSSGASTANSGAEAVPVRVAAVLCLFSPHVMLCLVTSSLH